MFSFCWFRSWISPVPVIAEVWWMKVAINLLHTSCHQKKRGNGGTKREMTIRLAHCKWLQSFLSVAQCFPELPVLILYAPLLFPRLAVNVRVCQFIGMRQSTCWDEMMEYTLLVVWTCCCWRALTQLNPNSQTCLCNQIKGRIVFGNSSKEVAAKLIPGRQQVHISTTLDLLCNVCFVVY